MFTARAPKRAETFRILAVYTVLETTMRYWTVVGLLALMGALWTQTPKSVNGQDALAGGLGRADRRRTYRQPLAGTIGAIGDITMPDDATL
jgi:hypothetical protein